MSMIDDKTVGILYEGSRAHMTFQRIALADLVEGGMHTGKPPVQSQRDTTRQSLQLARVFGDRMFGRNPHQGIGSRYLRHRHADLLLGASHGAPHDLAAHPGS